MINFTQYESLTEQTYDNQKHIEEWLKSNIATDLIEDNLVSLKGHDVLHWLFVSEKLPRRNDGRVETSLLNKYSPIENGGWYCRSQDPITGLEMEWGQFKPDTPRTTWKYRHQWNNFAQEYETVKEEKPIKYESPPKLASRIILPFISDKRWQKIATKYDTPIDMQMYSSNLIALAFVERLIYKHEHLNFNNFTYDFWFKLLTEIEELQEIQLKLCKYAHFWEWVINHPELPISITEGGKKCLCLLSYNIIAIGLPGVTMGIRKIDETLKEIHPDLKLFIKERREFNICFDSDIKPSSIRGVSRALFSLGVKLQQEGCKVYVLKWHPELGKGIDDVLFNAETRSRELLVESSEKSVTNSLNINEIEEDKISDHNNHATNNKIRLESVTNCLNNNIEEKSNQKHGVGFGKNGKTKDKNLDIYTSNLSQKITSQELLFQIYDQKTNFNYWCVQWLYQLRKPDLQFNKRWFSEGIEDIPDYPIVALKSAQYTGKTHLVVQKVQKLISQGEAVFVWTHRESLAKALASRFGISYRTEVDPLKGFIGYSLCVDSLLRKENGFNPNDWDEVTIIIDECEQVLQHLLFGTTSIQQYRISVLQTIIDLVPKIKQIIIADSDLSNVALDFCEKLLQQRAYLIVNQYQFEGMVFHRYQSNRQFLASLLKYLEPISAEEESKKTLHNQGSEEEEISAQKMRQRKIFVTTTGQKTTAKFGTIALERMIKKRYPHLKILRIDSETVENREHPAFNCLSKLTAIVGNYDVIICSPSIETGVSIEVYNHFDAVFSLSTGNLSPQSFLQFMWRLRDKVERHFYCPAVGTTYVGNGSTSPDKLLESTQRVAEKAIAAISKLDTQLISYDIQPLFLETWAKIGARINASSYCYGEVLEKLIVAQGHTLIDVESEDKVKAEDIKQNTKECRDERDNFTLSSHDIDEIKAKEIEESKQKTLTEICQLRKYKTKEKYGNISKSILEFDDEGIHTQLRLLYYLTLGNMFVEQRDKRKIEKLANDNQGQLWIPDVPKMTMKYKVDVLKGIGIIDLVERIRQEGIRSDDETILFLHQEGKKASNVVKEILGIKVHKYPIGFLNSLLGLIGYKVIKTDQIRVGKKRFWEYELKELPEWVDDTFNYWLEKDSAQSTE